MAKTAPDPAIVIPAVITARSTSPSNAAKQSMYVSPVASHMNRKT